MTERKGKIPATGASLRAFPKKQKTNEAFSLVFCFLGKRAVYMEKMEENIIKTPSI